MEHLIGRFASAGLKLVLSDAPIVGALRGLGATDIVQIDIQRSIKGNHRHEWFRIFPGAETNRIEVLGTDKKIGQLVLMVHEPPREFEEAPSWTAIKNARDKDPDNWPDVLAKDLGIRRDRLRVHYRKGKAAGASILRKTSSQKRHFLCGLDERQLFIAQLSHPVSTVREAHASLKRAEVTLAEGKVGKATRQGEWFMVKATDSELERIGIGLKKNLIFVQNKVPIGRGGNPHTADELLVLPGERVPGGDWPVRGAETFIRGHVRHVDHATVSFKTWHKVIRNNEANAGQAAPSGVGWVD
jgi:hypothetical protein